MDTVKAAIVIAPKDFRDETVVRAKRMFEKWNVDPVIVGFNSKECVGSHGAVYKPETTLLKITPQEFDILFLVDGLGVEEFGLYDQPHLLDQVRVFSSNNKIVAGVNNAVKIIAKANIVANKKIAIPKDVETDRLVRLYKGVISENEMECQTNIMSLRDYTKTEEFVAAILDKLGVR